jgi:hypothetical protein
MNNLFNRPSDPDATAIRERIFNVLPVLIATDGYVGLGRHDLLAKLDRTRVVVALTDAIAESIVTAAVREKPGALVGVEVAVHTDCVFVDGRIAAGCNRSRSRRSFAMFTALPATVADGSRSQEKFGLRPMFARRNCRLKSPTSCRFPMTERRHRLRLWRWADQLLARCSLGFR